MDKQIETAIRKIIEGCRWVKDDPTIHEDAKKLANLVINDCNKILRGEFSNV